MDPSGEPSVFATAPTGDWDNDSLAFDPTGSFGGALFLVEGQFTQSLYRISTTGNIESFATQLPDWSAGIAFSSGGDFGNKMYIANRNGKIYQVDAGHTPGDPVSEFTTLEGDPIGIAISTSGLFGSDTMYVSDISTGKILKVSPDGLPLGEFCTGLPILTGETGGLGIYFTHGRESMIIHDSANGDIWLVTPEPATVLLLGLGGLAVLRKRKR